MPAFTGIGLEVTSQNGSFSRRQGRNQARPPFEEPYFLRTSEVPVDRVQVSCSVRRVCVLILTSLCARQVHPRSPRTPSPQHYRLLRIHHYALLRTHFDGPPPSTHARRAVGDEGSLELSTASVRGRLSPRSW